MSFEGMSLLIVDDQQSIRKLCMTIGGSLGFTCSEAESAEAALAYLESNVPDLILVDLRLENMSGLEFLETAKKMLPRSEWTVDRLHKADGILVGSVADVRRKMDEFVEHINPEYFNFNNGGDLGLMPIETMKQQVRLFGEQIMPHYR